MRVLHINLAGHPHSIVRNNQLHFTPFELMHGDSNITLSTFWKSVLERVGQKLV